ncbi:hypothetical protein ACFRH4_50205 [Streptomyces mirabilis]|uniref:hypothetical protein n=1 Tax=Streptomyces mirabilis TaxID=68239 RepID=UPI0036A3F116
MNPEYSHVYHHPVPGQHAGDAAAFVAVTEIGIRLERREEHRRRRASEHRFARVPENQPDLVRAIAVRGAVSGGWPAPLGLSLTAAEGDAAVDRIAAEVLVVPRSERWREAVSTALVGPWCDPLWQTGHLPTTALGALRAEARALHRQLVPVWRRWTRHGRVLSLDADLGGLSLHDLVAADLDLLARTAGGVFEDQRLGAVLRGLTPAERTVVFAYAEGEGTTWTEAAAHVGAGAPEAFGERVRRKVKRLAAEQHRRLAQRSTGVRTFE